MNSSMIITKKVGIVGIAILILLGFLGFMFVSGVSPFSRDVYAKVVITYNDGSTQTSKANPTLAVLGMDIVNTANSKAIDHIDYYLVVTAQWTQSIITEGGTSADYSLRLATHIKFYVEYVSGEVDNNYPYVDKDISLTNTGVSSGASTEYKVLTVSASNLQTFIKGKGFVSGDKFKLWGGMTQDVTLTLLQGSTQLSSYTVSRSGIGIVSISLQYKEPSGTPTITSASIQWKQVPIYK